MIDHDPQGSLNFSRLCSRVRGGRLGGLDGGSSIGAIRGAERKWTSLKAERRGSGSLTVVQAVAAGVSIERVAGRRAAGGGRYVVALTLLLAACGQDPATKAEQQVQFLKDHNATLGEICAAARAAQDLFAARQDADGYKRMRSEAELQCLSARLSGSDETYGAVAGVDANAAANAVAANADAALNADMQATAIEEHAENVANDARAADGANADNAAGD